jgi:acetolactate synthase-1/3 small subunit/acetolactate synthase II small subunit
VSERLVISFTPAEGAVIRMLGMVERRGYALRGVAMEEQANGASLVLDVEPRDPSRRVDVIARQLDRLVEVNNVSIVTGTQAAAA